MAYQVDKGLEESRLPSWLKDAGHKYGVFEDGRVNYTDALVAPTVMCTLKCGEHILLAKRGQGLADANGYWSTINGFIDEDKPVAEIAAQEFLEELGVRVDPTQIKVAQSYKLTNPQEKRSYIVFPCLAVVKSKPPIKLDFEHTEYKWIKRGELQNYSILDDLPLAIDAALSLE